MTGSGNPVRILLVCLGNICRSPMAEGILRHLSEKENFPLVADSAGTADYHTGEPPDRRAVDACAAAGVDISPLRSRQLVYADFYRFDWILTMDRNNLLHVQARAPQEHACRVGLFLDPAGRHSGQKHSVADPYYGGAEAFRECFQTLHAGALTLLRQSPLL